MVFILDFLHTAKRKWQEKKPVVMALALGLVVGPFISNNIGWQVTSGTLEEQVRTAVVEQQVLYCVERVRATGQILSDLEYSARRDLAEKWAVMPGQDSAEYDVTYACSKKLGER